MNGTGHYDEAEKILDTVSIADELDDETELKLRLAHVHAELAVAGALAAFIGLAVRGTPLVVSQQ
jgi:hypothetical protein